MYRGARQEGADYFDDVVDAQEGGGVFKGGTGLGGYEGKVREEITPEGVVYRGVRCEGCGLARDVWVTYQELFFLAQNGPNRPLILPENWGYSDQEADFELKAACPKCSSVFELHVELEEARNRFNQGFQNGYIPPQVLEGWKQRVLQFVQRPR